MPSGWLASRRCSIPRSSPSIPTGLKHSPPTSGNAPGMTSSRPAAWSALNWSGLPASTCRAKRSSRATAWASPSTGTAPRMCSRWRTSCSCVAILAARAPASVRCGATRTSRGPDGRGRREAEARLPQSAWPLVRRRPAARPRPQRRPGHRGDAGRAGQGIREHGRPTLSLRCPTSGSSRKPCANCA
jgi:hypothetical protein